MCDSNDLAHKALRLALRFVPRRHRIWIAAMAAEIDTIDVRSARISWAFGGLSMALRIGLADLLTGRWRRQGEEPPYGFAATVGMLLIAPPLYFVAASISNQLGFPLMFAPLATIMSRSDAARVFNVLSPVLFLGGIILALALNVAVLTRLESSVESNRSIRRLSVQLNIWNLAVVITAAGLMTILIGYVVLENFAMA
ncbi:MAG: hypothetical protein JO187_07940 [Acidobacteria bacterium]|nr:hypothetical protein [Acidobacteriota bacterium]